LNFVFLPAGLSELDLKTIINLTDCVGGSVIARASSDIQIHKLIGLQKNRLRSKTSASYLKIQDTVVLECIKLSYRMTKNAFYRQFKDGM
jgi:hypothetical protein